MGNDRSAADRGVLEMAGISQHLSTRDVLFMSQPQIRFEQQQRN